MRHLLSLLSLLAVAFSASAKNTAPAATDSVADSQSVGLVLSGGGAKGIAHIGVIQALEDNNIPIDYITGTSMGAIVGGLYACGYTPAEMLDVIRSQEFAYWSTGTIDPKLTYYFMEPAPTPTILKINLGGDQSGLTSLLPSALINPLPMNFAFMELFAPFTAQCEADFNKLFVPFRCVASNVDKKHKTVFSSGQIGDAIRASMTFPLVFHPIEVDGDRLYDGGIYDNFPVDVMDDTFAPDFVFGVDVSAGNSDGDDSSMIAQLENMIMQHSDYNVPPRRGMKLRIDLDRFGLLDFDKANEIYRIGYDHAVAVMDSLKMRVHTRIPAESRKLRREVFKSLTPELVFDSVKVTGGHADQNAFIASRFMRHSTDTFGVIKARDAYYRLITPGKLRNLMPTAVPDGPAGPFTLRLKATIQKPLDLGIGSYLTTSTNSMLFLSAAYRTMSFSSLDMSLNGWLGQNYVAVQGRAGISLLRNMPTSLSISGVASRQKYFPNDRLIFQNSESTVATKDEFYARVAYGTAAGRNGKFEFSVGYGHLADKYYNRPSATNPAYRRDDITQNLGQARAFFEHYTLNDHNSPTAGAQYSVSAFGVLGYHYFTFGGNSGSARARRAWAQIEFKSRNYWSLSPKISLGLETDVLASNRKLLHYYHESLLDAPVYDPCPSLTDVFLPEYRAESVANGSLVPVWKIGSFLQLRGYAEAFVPLRDIQADKAGLACWSDWLPRVEFFGRLEAVATVKSTTIKAFGYYSGAHGAGWNFGISLGAYIRAPRFLR